MRKSHLTKKFVLFSLLAALILGLCACENGTFAGMFGAQAGSGGHPGSMKDLAIVIDPGHGGEDRGAQGVGGASEDALNLQIAKLLQARLAEQGVKVTMTRTSEQVDYSGEGDTPKMKDMNNRAKLFEAADPDAIISIHMNSCDAAEVFGAETYYWKDNGEGKKLAQHIQKALVAGMPVKSPRKTRAGDYFVLHAVDAPSTLVECGFLSNAEEEKHLQQAEYQGKLADCIVQGVRDYFGIK